MITYGDADVMLAGGSEASIELLGVAGFAALRATSRRNDDPEGASRPFDKIVMDLLSEALVCLFWKVESMRKLVAQLFIVQWQDMVVPEMLFILLHLIPLLNNRLGDVISN